MHQLDNSKNLNFRGAIIAISLWIASLFVLSSTQAEPINPMMQVPYSTVTLKLVAQEHGALTRTCGRLLTKILQKTPRLVKDLARSTDAITVVILAESFSDAFEQLQLPGNRDLFLGESGEIYNENFRVVASWHQVFEFIRARLKAPNLPESRAQIVYRTIYELAATYPRTFRTHHSRGDEAGLVRLTSMPAGYYPDDIVARWRRLSSISLNPVRE
jgi:hypothetical protein